MNDMYSYVSQENSLQILSNVDLSMICHHAKFSVEFTIVSHWSKRKCPSLFTDRSDLLPLAGIIIITSLSTKSIIQVHKDSIHALAICYILAISYHLNSRNIPTLSCMDGWPVAVYFIVVVGPVLV